MRRPALILGLVMCPALAAISAAAGYFEGRQKESQNSEQNGPTLEQERAAPKAGSEPGHTIMVRLRWLELDPSKFGPRLAEWNRFVQRHVSIDDDKNDSHQNNSGGEKRGGAAVLTPFSLFRLDDNGKSAREFDALVESLKRDGAITVRAEPNLTTTEGRLAEFHDGGQVAVPVLNAGGAPPEVQFLKYGITMRILPRVWEKDTINCQATFEISDRNVDREKTVAGQVIPELNVRMVRLSVLAKDKESVVFGGLPRAVDETPKSEKSGGGTENRDGAGSKPKREVVIVLTPELVR